MKKRVLAIVLTIAIATTAIACSKKDNKAATSGASDKPAVEESEETANSDKTAQNGAGATDVREMLGRLYILNADQQDATITAVKLIGNRVGSDEDINGLEPSSDNIRCIFEMNEWIGIYPVTDIDAEGFRIFIFPHENDFSAYTSTYLSDHAYAANGYFQNNEDIPGVKYYTEAYIDSQYNPAGYYDIVFFKVDQPIAVVPVKVYAEGELDNATDLKAVMASERK